MKEDKPKSCMKTNPTSIGSMWICLPKPLQQALGLTLLHPPSLPVIRRCRRL